MIHTMVETISLKGQALKRYLLSIIDKIDEETTVEDIFRQIALLEDIYIAEQQIDRGEEISQEELENRSETWIPTTPSPSPSCPSAPRRVPTRRGDPAQSRARDKKGGGG